MRVFSLPRNLARTLVSHGRPPIRTRDRTLPPTIIFNYHYYRKLGFKMYIYISFTVKLDNSIVDNFEILRFAFR